MQKRENFPIATLDEGCNYDLIGDVHGCYPELLLLLKALNYEVLTTKNSLKITPPKGRKLVFVGDLADRGPDSAAVLRLVSTACAQGVAHCVCGNHDDKLWRFLKGNKVSLVHGLDKTVAQLATASEEFKAEIRDFLEKLPTHILLDNGKLVVAHAGLKEKFHGRTGGFTWQCCLFGETLTQPKNGELPQRLNWTLGYEGKALVVYGHTPILEATWSNNTVNIDTGCCFGGKLTALRYPENETVSIAALEQYAVPNTPLGRLEERLIAPE